MLNIYKFKWSKSEDPRSATEYKSTLIVIMSPSWTGRQIKFIHPNLVKFGKFEIKHFFKLLSKFHGIWASFAYFPSHSNFDHSYVFLGLRKTSSYLLFEFQSMMLSWKHFHLNSIPDF